MNSIFKNIKLTRLSFFSVKSLECNFKLSFSNIQLLLVLLFFGAYGYSQNLQGYINEALANSPEIKKFELQHKRVEEKVNEVNTLPNTQFGVGYFISEPETRTGAQRFKVSAKQMLPAFGIITARENYVDALADAVFEEVAVAKRKLIASVSKSYYNLYALKAKQVVLDENINLLNTYEKLALTSVESGKASAVDVLRLQMRQNELVQQKQVLEQGYLAEQTAFNKLLNRDKTISVKVVDNLPMPLSDELFDSKKLTLHPELLKYDKLYLSVKQSELINQKDRQPMLGFGLDYVAVSKRPNMNFNDNGKDIIMPMISISIPIFSNKNKSKTQQNKLKQQEILAEKENRLNVLEAMLDKAVKNSNSAKISYTTQAKNLKQARDAETILIKSYQTGTIDFNDVLDVQALQLKFQINQIEAVKSYYMQTTIINYLTK
ncbi:TolC family protein [Tenacibaculum sp. UWU-22]|uniref:TolC family protein n=1 Tax=Tenacibaculum sp. UWU-22 TaxID=3234187 RepID=UPI0034DB7170